MKQILRCLAIFLAGATLAGCVTTSSNQTENMRVATSSAVSLSDVVNQADEDTMQRSDRLLPPKEDTVSTTSSSKIGVSSTRKPTATSSVKDEAKVEQAEIVFSSKNVALGDMLTITVIGAKSAVTASSNMLGFAPKFFRQTQYRQVALLPISYKLKPDTYQLTIVVDGKMQQFQIVAEAKTFNVQNLWVDEKTTQETIADQQANQEWNEKIEPLKPVSDSTQHWNGAFLQPIQGRLTTEYAAQRYTNGGSTSAFHGGIDLAAATGTPVAATAAGRVLFADFIQMTGNTVVIEHGYGLKSFYYHMSALDVIAGDVVTRGQQVGKVGSTGFSTGPHLHFAMAVNNVFTNPWPLFEQEPKF